MCACAISIGALSAFMISGHGHLLSKIWNWHQARHQENQEPELEPMEEIESSESKAEKNCNTSVNENAQIIENHITSLSY